MSSENCGARKLSSDGTSICKRQLTEADKAVIVASIKEFAACKPQNLKDFTISPEAKVAVFRLIADLVDCR